MRKVTWGTPTRSLHYLFPRGKWALVAPSLAAGVALLMVLLGLHAVGFRSPVAPGAVINPHAPIESRCEECHTARSGTANLRCQRCHDPSGAGRLANSAHVLFGSRDPQKAAAAPDLACAGCHVEHRGRSTRLRVVDPVQCSRCHFRSLAAHPEFAIFRAKTVEVPGLKFGHAKHIEDMIKELRLAAPLATCARCHRRLAGTRDFEPISFDEHCASCHGKGGRLAVGIDPIPEQDVLSIELIGELGYEGLWLQRGEEFESNRGRIAKTEVHHQDPWVLFNLAKLRREVDPEGWAAERGAVQARLDQLERRLALSEPLAGLDKPALEARASGLANEIKGLQGRIDAQAGALDPVAGLGRLEEVALAARAVADAEIEDQAQRLGLRAAALRGRPAPPAALPRDEYDARRSELLAVLDAVENVDSALKPRAEDLRRRLLALTPGEAGIDVLTRVRDRRAAEIARVRDEIRLRDQGILPPGQALLAPERDLIARKIDEVRERLDTLSQAPEPEAPVSAEERERKRESIEVLTAPCAKCHVVDQARISPPIAARQVLVRANYVHEPHLLPVQGDCFHCHPSIQQSKLSQDLNLKGVESCRECHKARSVRQECQTCHRYHPPAVP